ncbi:lytic transglycosylase domain-containing protein [Spirosoma areae]
MTKLLLMVAVGFGTNLLTHLSSFAQTGQLLALSLAKSTRTLTKLSALSKPDDSPVHFCGETIPTNHPAIIARWTRTLNQQVAYARDLALLKRRASVVFPLIEPILKQYRIPSDFKFLPLLESAVTNRAVSRKGAAGFWQLMPQTAQSLGLTVSRRHDERFNLQKATHAACRYLTELYEQFGSWMLVATAYNAGPTYIQQLSNRYPGEHPMALPYRAAETKAYLFQAVIIKELLTRPQAYRNQLSSQNLADLSDESTPMPLTERTAILASFDMSETDFPDVRVEPIEANFVADSTTTVVLLTETDDEQTAESIAESPKEVMASSSPQAVLPVDRLATRSLSEGSLSDGQLCVFQVVQPVTINGRAFAVGDVIQAHIEIMDAASGRVYLRTDHLTTAQSQQMVPLNLVATGQPKQPGVGLPIRLEGWQLMWEAL